MKSMTLRGIDPVLADKLRQAAKKQGKSMNQFIIEAIRKSLGLDKTPKYSCTYNDLDHLFGKWSQDEFERIQGKIESERTIDQELWK